MRAFPPGRGTGPSQSIPMKSALPGLVVGLSCGELGSVHGQIADTLLSPGGPERRHHRRGRAEPSLSLSTPPLSDVTTVKRVRRPLTSGWRESSS